MRPAEDISQSTDVLVEIADGPIHDYEGVRRVEDTGDRLVIRRADGTTVVYQEYGWLSFIAGSEVEVSTAVGTSAQSADEAIPTTRVTRSHETPDWEDTDE